MHPRMAAPVGHSHALPPACARRSSGVIPRVVAAVLAASLLAAAEEGPDIHLWPLVENTPAADGGRTTSALLLWHRTTDGHGRTVSQHLLNWVSSERFTAVLPLWYRIGEPGRQDSALLPLWFHGPDYTITPLALSGAWRDLDGGRNLWVTPLFHRRTDVSGRITDQHALTWLQGEGYDILFPLAYRVGKSGHEHSGVIPAWFSGPGWWAAPPLLTASWRRDNGGSSTWVTPLFHLGRDAGGAVDGMHLLNWVHSADGDALLPLAWASGPPGARSHGVLPLWVDGPGYRASPLLLSGMWREADGGSTTWITPLFHRTADADGATRSMHLLTWYHRQDLDVVLPLGWMAGRPGQRTGAVLPLYFQGVDSRALIPLWLQGRDWWVAPPLLSGAVTRADGSRTLVATPLYHQHSGADGSSSRHVGLWFAGDGPGGSYRMLLPLWWRVQHDGATWSGLAPLWFSGPHAGAAPAALSAWWDEPDGGSSLWVTPLFHRRTAADGSTASLHAGPWWQNASDDGLDRDGWPGRTESRGLFPLWWRQDVTAHGSTTSSSALLPLWMSGPDWWCSPPLLSTWRRDPGGGSTTWVTPFFHRSTDADGGTRGMHALLWFQEGDRRMLLPFWYQAGSGDARTMGLIPLWFSTPAGWTVPPALSWHRRSPDASTSTWITPLFHEDRDADGSLRSMHLLNWMQGPDWQSFFPLAYRTGPPEARHQGLIPLAFSGPGWWFAPPALSVRWRTADGGDSTWITPLAHVERDADGRIRGGHVLNWAQGEDWRTLFPLFWQAEGPGGRRQGVLPFYLDGPGWWLSPVGLSGSWRRDDGGSSTWITPLAHIGSDAAGRTTDWHVLNVVHGRDGDAILPLAWQSGPPQARSRVALPLYFQGPDHLAIAPLYFRWRGADGGTRSLLLPFYATGADWWASPLALSGGWRGDDGSSTTLVTPFYHRTVDADGTRHQHLLNWISGRDLQAVAPLWWDWRSADGTRHDLLAPLWHGSRSTDGSRAIDAYPLLFAYRSGAAVDTSLSTQLWPFLVQDASDGSEVNLLWRLYHQRRVGRSSEVMVGPLWWSERQADAPAAWQVLGGLFGRDVDTQHQTSLDYALWGALRFGGRTSYVPPAASP